MVKNDDAAHDELRATARLLLLTAITFLQIKMDTPIPTVTNHAMTPAESTAHRVATLREIAAMLDSLASLLALHELPRLQRSLQDDSAFIEKVADSIEEAL